MGSLFLKGSLRGYKRVPDPPANMIPLRIVFSYFEHSSTLSITHDILFRRRVKNQVSPWLFYMKHPTSKKHTSSIALVLANAIIL